MNTWQNIVAAILLLLIAAFIAYTLPASPPDVSIHFSGYQTNAQSVVPFLEKQDRIEAILTLSNGTHHSISYYGDFLGEPYSRCFSKETEGWNDRTLVGCGLSSRFCILGPFHHTNFAVLVGHQWHATQVTVDYARARTTNAFWDVWPRWMERNLPGRKTKYRAAITIHK
jgi:hypothetical protein